MRPSVNELIKNVPVLKQKVDFLSIYALKFKIQLP